MLIDIFFICIFKIKDKIDICVQITIDLAERISLNINASQTQLPFASLFLSTIPVFISNVLSLIKKINNIFLKTRFLNIFVFHKKYFVFIF